MVPMELVFSRADSQHWGPIRLDYDSFTAYCNERPLALTPLEFDILAYLVQNNHRVVPKSELVSEVIKGACGEDSSLLRVHISHLRKKLGESAAVIQTMRSRGFRACIS